MSELLVDSHALLWYGLDAPELSARARSVLADESTTCYVSVASLWELSIKYGLKRLAVPGGMPTLVAQVERWGAWLSIAVGDAIRVAELPHHHRDPFDRIIVAQALNRGLPIVSADEQFDSYAVQRIW